MEQTLIASTAQTLHYQLISEHSQPLALLLAKVHYNNFCLLSTQLEFSSEHYYSSFFIIHQIHETKKKKPVEKAFKWDQVSRKSVMHPPVFALNVIFSYDIE